MSAETVVRNHLQAFLERRGVAAILEDYHEDARFIGESAVYHGKAEIGGFFTAFLAALPPRGIERFELRSMRVEGNVAYITWRIGDDVPLGTDTFVVRNGKIASQTFAMHAPKRG